MLSRSVCGWRKKGISASVTSGSTSTFSQDKAQGGDLLFAKVPNEGTEVVKQAALKLLKPLADRVHTLTSGNGKQFARHEAIAEARMPPSISPIPYASLERGLNENTNGLSVSISPNRWINSTTDPGNVLA